MEETGTVSGDASKTHAHLHHDKGLLAIGLFKLLEAVFFLLIGVRSDSLPSSRSGGCGTEPGREVEYELREPPRHFSV